MIIIEWIKGWWFVNHQPFSFRAGGIAFLLYCDILEMAIPVRHWSSPSWLRSEDTI